MSNRSFRGTTIVGPGRPTDGEFGEDETSIGSYAEYPVDEHVSDADDDIIDAVQGLSPEERKMRRYMAGGSKNGKR